LPEPGSLHIECAPGKIALLAVPVVGGTSTYHSYVLVPAASPALSMTDLKGKRFAFGMR